jgi:sugar phosphate isomerase/epimerase
MKFAICNETFENWKQDNAFACIAELGYTGVEIAPFTISNDVRDVPVEGRFRLRKMVEEAGLVVTGLHWVLAKTIGLHLTSPDSAVRKRTADYVIELIKFCSDLGGAIMVFGSPKQRDLLQGVSYEQGLQFAAEVFHQTMTTAESRKVTIAFEPLARRETNFMNTADQAVELIDRVAHGNFQLHLDVKAMCDMGKPVPQIIRENKKYTVYYHANDPNARGPGTSGLNHKPFADALKDNQYDGWVSVEVFDYKPDPRAIAADALAYLKKTYI